MGKTPGLFTRDIEKIDPIYALEGVLAVELEFLQVKARVPDPFTYQIVLFGDSSDHFDAAQAIVTENASMFGLRINRAHYEEDENLRRIADIPTTAHIRILEMVKAE